MADTSSGLADHTHSIRQYYDQNTKLFLRFGSSPAVQAIHRAVWANEVTSLPDALNYSNRLLMQQAQALQASLPSEPLHIVDLGCGVGASLFYLEEHLHAPFRAVGLTLSGVQAQLAGKNALRYGYTKNLLITQADFLHVPLQTGFRLAYSIEAFAHAPDPAAYLEQAERLLLPGGRLVLCDDFLEESIPGTLDPHSQVWLQAYQLGWRIPTLIPISILLELADARGLRLVEDRDLTPFLRLNSLPEGLARLLLSLGRMLPQSHPIVPSMLGSMALQQCLRRGIIRYHWMAFERLDDG